MKEGKNVQAAGSLDLNCVSLLSWKSRDFVKVGKQARSSCGGMQEKEKKKESAPPFSKSGRGQGSGGP